MSINRANITGNLTRDAELRRSQGGGSVLNFGVAVNDRRKVGDEWQDVPNYIDCVMFGQRAESLAQHLTKGTKVAVEGKLRYSSWETKAGERRSKVEVAVDDLEFMSSRRERRPEPEPEPEPAPAKADDIPF